MLRRLRRKGSLHALFVAAWIPYLLAHCLDCGLGTRCQPLPGSVSASLAVPAAVMPDCDQHAGGRSETSDASNDPSCCESNGKPSLAAVESPDVPTPVLRVVADLPAEIAPLASSAIAPTIADPTTGPPIYLSQRVLLL